MEDDDNWDLFAVVRSCRFSEPAATTDPFSSFAPPPLVPKAEAGDPPPEGGFTGAGGGRGGLLPFSFPDLLKPRSSDLELEELCKPFFPQTHRQNPPPSIGSPPSSSSSLRPAMAGRAGAHGTQQQRQPHRPLSQISRSKRRKTQQKRVVCHVPAEGLSSDMWAWRKYGQKPIKGSPYPRGYYRCSSSKGCLARKQVERSRTDPAMFVITYTAEHNHPMPTHRNSLAGSTRNKFPTTGAASSAAPPAASAGTGDRDGEHPSSSSAAAELSPTTPLTASMEDELLRSRPEKGDDGDVDEDGDDVDEDEEEGMLFVEDMEVMGEDELLFLGSPEAATAATSSTAALFDNDGGYGEHFLPPPWLSSGGGGGNTAAAAGGT